MPKLKSWFIKNEFFGEWYFIWYIAVGALRHFAIQSFSLRFRGPDLLNQLGKKCATISKCKHSFIGIQDRLPRRVCLALKPLGQKNRVYGQVCALQNKLKYEAKSFKCELSLSRLEDASVEDAAPKLSLNHPRRSRQPVAFEDEAH